MRVLDMCSPGIDGWMGKWSYLYSHAVYAWRTHAQHRIEDCQFSSPVAVVLHLRCNVHFHAHAIQKVGMLGIGIQ